MVLKTMLLFIMITAGESKTERVYFTSEKGCDTALADMRAKIPTSAETDGRANHAWLAYAECLSP